MIQSKTLTKLNWFGTGLIAIGSAIIATQPEIAKTSIVPFVILVIGQIIAMGVAKFQLNWPYFYLSIVFLCIDSYGIFVRLTN
jgi:hypothetical protein